MPSRLAQCFAGATLCLLVLLAPAGAAQNLVPVPTLKARVTDLTGSLSADQLTRLEQKLAAFEARKGSQVAVLIVATTQPETIEQYSIRVAERWKLGRKGVDDGALLLVAKDDRAMRIEVGYGLEGALPDAIAKRIIEEIIVPRFKSGDFYGGIDAGADAMIKVVEGEPLPPASEQGHAQGAADSGTSLLLFTVGIFVVIALAMVLRAVLGRVPAAVLIGAAAAVIVWLLVSSLAAAAAAGLLAFVFTLFGGTTFGGYGGWGSSGGFGGGFGGGGGGFGGGGASGRW